MYGEGVTSAWRGRRIWKLLTREADLEVADHEGEFGICRAIRRIQTSPAGTVALDGRGRGRSMPRWDQIGREATDRIGRTVWGKWRRWTGAVEPSWERDKQHDGGTNHAKDTSRAKYSRACHTPNEKITCLGSESIFGSCIGIFLTAMYTFLNLCKVIRDLNILLTQTFHSVPEHYSHP